MNHISQLKDKIVDLLHEEEVSVYDVKWTQSQQMKILEVSIIKPDGTMDIDTCACISAKISDMLDEEDCIPYEYYLEVCSPGAERELRSQEEIVNAMNEYVYVKLKNPQDGFDEIKGYLKEVNEQDLWIEYLDKTVKKKKKIWLDNIALIRLSVKI